MHPHPPTGTAFVPDYGRSYTGGEKYYRGRDLEKLRGAGRPGDLPVPAEVHRSLDPFVQHSWANRSRIRQLCTDRLVPDSQVSYRNGARLFTPFLLMLGLTARDGLLLP